MSLPTLSDNLATKFALFVRPNISSRDQDLTPGLDARIADPAWILGRQWQIGEFFPSNGGSPVQVDIQLQSWKLTEVEVGNATTPVPTTSLDAVAEREQGAADSRRSVRLGQHFERLLRLRLPNGATSAIANFRKTFPWIPVSSDVVSVKRGIDGLRLLDALKGNENILPSEFETIANEFIRWDESLHGTESSGPASWNASLMRHTYKASAKTETTNLRLLINSQGGNRNWHSASALEHRDVPLRSSVKATPTRATFHGQPSPRYWEFEDSRMDFGGLDTATTDLLKLVLIEFALCYGNDWFVVPLDVDTGAVSQILNISVTDTFGRTLRVYDSQRPRPKMDWRAFSLSESAASTVPKAPLLYVPKRSGRDESEPIEEVFWALDENAGVAWAVEHTVTGPEGEGVRGFDVRNKAPVAVPGNGEVPVEGLRYRLSTDAPPHWVPYVPNGNPTAPRFVRAALAGAPLRSGLTRILGAASDGLKEVAESAIPRAGASVRLRRARERGADGTTVVWTSRLGGPGTGEALSGLRFDKLDEK